MANAVVGKYRVVGDAVRSLDADEKVRVMEHIEALKDLDIPAGYVLLVQPIYPSLNFGKGGVHDQQEDPSRGNIVFNGGTWSGPEDHENLTALLKAHPEIIELRPVEDAPKSFVCAECDMEFDTKGKLTAHVKAAHKE